MQLQLEGSGVITGGSGFLGRAILRRSKREGWQAKFTVVSRDDHKHSKLLRQYPYVRCVRADVAKGVEYLASIFRGHTFVIHAAASKHVDLAEKNVVETIETNVIGTQNVLMAAMIAGVEKVVFISTDKACSPVNVYGQTKVLGERLIGEFGSRGDVYATGARYGNVVGSTGSVIPLFKEQFAATGKVKVTDPNMTRFWISADEAIDLILLAYHHAEAGSIVIPSPKAMTIGSLVAAVCPEGEVEIVGRRPGEKVDERLLNVQESLLTIKHKSPNFYELLHSGNPTVTREPFTLSSKSPEGGWMTVEEMREIISDSEGV